LTEIGKRNQEREKRKKSEKVRRQGLCRWRLEVGGKKARSSKLKVQSSKPKAESSKLKVES
jgi:hypothetical protein